MCDQLISPAKYFGLIRERQVLRRQLRRATLAIYLLGACLAWTLGMWIGETGMPYLVEFANP